MLQLQPRALVPVALLVASLLIAPMAAAHSGHGAYVVLEAGEGEDCPDGTYCFDVLQGDPSDITAGAEVELELRNPSSNGIRHNAHVTDVSDANRGGDTSGSAAFASTDDADPGQTVTVNFTVPDGVEDAYIWCDIGGHESGGMWLETGGTGSDDGGDGANGSPGFGAVAALGAAGAALVLRRR